MNTQEECWRALIAGEVLLNRDNGMLFKLSRGTLHYRCNYSDTELKPCHTISFFSPKSFSISGESEVKVVKGSKMERYDIVFKADVDDQGKQKFAKFLEGLVFPDNRSTAVVSNGMVINSVSLNGENLSIDLVELDRSDEWKPNRGT